ncbi:MAG: DUF3572 family protein [Alphaproteobacteria bacterium]|nr:DUF3572 family protein [Alphaproteobacteria bacterium]MBV9692234.1 DUF3572 family protein [Alphaproteobacteria bacterium]
MTEDAAATLALDALAFVAASEGALDRLVAESGIDAADLRARAAEPEVLVAVLDFLLTSEALLVEFCDGGSGDVRAVHIARHVLAQVRGGA